MVPSDGHRGLDIQFPEYLLYLPGEYLAQLTAIRMSGREGTPSIVVPFLTQLVGKFESFPGAAGVKLVHSAIDMLSTMFSETLDLRNKIVDSRLELLQQMLDYIEENLHSPEFGPPQVAAAHFISVRHRHSIFSAQGETVSSWIRTRRLERCRLDLIDPAYTKRTIAAIAARWGFTDAAHFSRMFKAMYGHSPREYRQQFGVHRQQVRIDPFTYTASSLTATR